MRKHEYYNGYRGQNLYKKKKVLFNLEKIVIIFQHFKIAVSKINFIYFKKCRDSSNALNLK